MRKERIERAVEIIEYAIKNGISVKEASVKCGFSDTYVKNIKALVYENYDNGTLDDEMFSLFDTSYKKYINQRSLNNSIPDDGQSIIKEINRPVDIPLTVNGEKIILNVETDKANLEWVSGSNYPPNHVKTLDELLRATKVDLNLWKVDTYTVNKWDVTSWKNDIPETIQNWQVKAHLIRDSKVFKEQQIGEIFLNMIKDYQPPVNQQKLKDQNEIKENNLLEISIFDLHIGKLAWGGGNI